MCGGSLTQSNPVRRFFFQQTQSRRRNRLHAVLFFQKWMWPPADKTSPSGARSYKPSVAFTFFGEPPKRARSYKNVTAASVLESDWVLDLARLWASFRGRTRCCTGVGVGLGVWLGLGLGVGRWRCRW